MWAHEFHIMLRHVCRSQELQQCAIVGVAGRLSGALCSQASTERAARAGQLCRLVHERAGLRQLQTVVVLSKAGRRHRMLLRGICARRGQTDVGRQLVEVAHILLTALHQVLLVQLTARSTHINEVAAQYRDNAPHDTQQHTAASDDSERGKAGGS